MVSRQEQKTILAKLITGSLCSFIGLNWISLVRVSGKALGRLVLDALEDTKVDCRVGALLCESSPARQLRAAPLCGKTRPARGMSGFWVRQIDTRKFAFTKPRTVTSNYTIWQVHQPVESKTRTYHGRVGWERAAGRRGGVGKDWTPTEQSSRRYTSFVPSKET